MLFVSGSSSITLKLWRTLSHSALFLGFLTASNAYSTEIFFKYPQARKRIAGELGIFLEYTLTPCLLATSFHKDSGSSINLNISIKSGSLSWDSVSGPSSSSSSSRYIEFLLKFWSASKTKAKSPRAWVTIFYYAIISWCWLWLFWGWLSSIRLSVNPFSNVLKLKFPCEPSSFSSEVRVSFFYSNT